jgi:hypothetical protein
VPATIEANRAALAEQFVARAEFRALYDALTDAQYVDALFIATGINATADERAALVGGLQNSTETRATVLRKIVDGTMVNAEGTVSFTTSYGRSFSEQENNRAFVMMQYFGYLRRDPDQAGYTFWLGKLNQYNNYIDAQMVRSFILSDEYRDRFGAQ